MRRLLERDSELRRLNALVRRVGRTPGHVVLMRGEAGIGKTALVTKFVTEMSQPVRVLQGWCEPLSSPRPLGPLIDALAGMDRRAAADLTGALAEGDSATVYRQLLCVLRGGARWVWVIEDVHWADGATLDLLRFIGRRIGSLPLLLVMTYRDDEVGPQHPLTVALGDVATCAAITRIRLNPLSRDAVVALAGGSDLNATDLHRLTGGNPFYVTEILAAAKDRESGDALPRSVAEAVWGRLARLSDAARDTVYAAAVCGPRAECVLVEKVCPHALSALDECLRAGVLDADHGVVEFRHELARRATLDQIPGRRRRALHSAAMAALADPPVEPDRLAALAFHADQAGDDDAVVRYGVAGARRAAQLGAHRQAAQLYALVRSRAGTIPPQERVAWIEGHAFACYLSGEAEAAAGLWREAIEIRREMGDRLGEGENLRLLSQMLWGASGHAVEGIEAARSSVRLLQDCGPTPQLAWALANMVHLTAVSYDPGCAEYAERATALGTEIGEPGVVLRARCFAELASIFGGGARWDVCEATWHAAMAEEEMAEHVGLVGAGMCWAAALHHDLDRARRYVDDMSAFCEDNELGAYQPMAVGTAALVALHRGDWGGAMTGAEDVLTRPGVALVNAIIPRTVAALVRARRGEKPVGPALDAPVADAGPGDFFLFGAGWAARAEIAWLAGDDERAAAEAAVALRAAGPRADPWITGRLLRWLHLTGTPCADPATTGPQTPYQLEVSGAWQAAAAEWTRLGCPYDAAIAQLGGDIDAVEAAFAAFRRLGARAAARRARQRLSEIRGPALRGPVGHSKTDPHRLTQRQRQVADLLAAGHSDTAIAAALHLSPKTVGHHVEAILAKLGVNNRIQAAHALRQQPAIP
ncbi:LuxR family transcriptional regulator [Mycobacterium palustre]|uniref:LuxR family transcriptional regulator n=1 Tax=Mycobacterium palustre TaxID=153971 RepID=A0A1X1YYZ6_9MYCO|nr:LuxR family transcriptional regulator [Mycobacterium palustre]